MTTQTERVSDERLLEMLAGCEGVTPGPWDARTNLIRAIDGDEAIPIAEMCAPWKKHRRLATAVRQEFNNSLHIAGCDPDTIGSIVTELLALRKAAAALVNAKALSEVRATVAGWNGEGLPADKRYERHADKLGATLPKTTCGAVYALDDAMQSVRALTKEPVPHV